MEDLNREDLMARLRVDVVEVKFKKKNGDERTMMSTLAQDRLPEPVVVEVVEGAPIVEVKERKINPDIVGVWDMEAEAWRSFRWDSVIEVVAGIPEQYQKLHSQVYFSARS